MKWLLWPTLFSAAAAHSALTHPRPRNAVDADELPWRGAIPSPIPFEPWCPFPSREAAVSDERNLSGANGQACFWFSNGCAIGCDECDGDTRGPIPSFRCTDTKCTPTGKPRPGWTPTAATPGPKAPICGPLAPPGSRVRGRGMNATMCDPTHRTINTAAPCGGADDFYFFSPWRAPGYAPVIDSCGSAGGRLPGQGLGGFGAQYVNTSHAAVGDLGSQTLRAAPGAVWMAGGEATVAWAHGVNHGGGYSYRLCPVGRVLDEDCFNEHPLTMVGPSKLRWGGEGGRTLPYDAVSVTTGTKAGVMWRKNPVPRSWKNATGAWGAGSNHLQTGWGFQPVCDDNGMDRSGREQSCTGMWGPYNLEIVDVVAVPAHLPAGGYVLSWRMDQEESNQIWQSCADVQIISGNTVADAAASTPKPPASKNPAAIPAIPAISAIPTASVEAGGAVGGSDESAWAVGGRAGGWAGGWVAGPSLTTVRKGLGLAAVGSRLYAAGGSGAGGATMEVLDTSVAGGHWGAGTVLSTARYSFGLAAVGTKLYAVGGIGTGTAMSTSVLDTAAAGGGWTAGPPLKAPRYYLGLAAVGGALYAVGGYGGADAPTTVEVLQTATAAAGWQAGPSLTTERYYLAVAAVGAKLYAVGGSGAHGAATATVEVLDTASAGGWVAGPSMTTPRFEHGLGVLGSRLYAVGGALAGGVTSLASVEVLDTAVGGGWAAGPELSTPRRDFAVAGVGSKLYAVGGAKGSGAMASVEVLEPIVPPPPPSPFYKCTLDPPSCTTCAPSDPDATSFAFCNRTCHFPPSPPAPPVYKCVIDVGCVVCNATDPAATTLDHCKQELKRSCAVPGPLHDV